VRRLILAAALAASLLAVSAGAAAASAPAAHGGAAPASAATRPVVVYEPTLTGPRPFRSVVRPSSWYLTVGPATEFRGTHWSSWGGKTAAGTGTMYVIDFGIHNEGHATLKLYDVRIHDGTRYFSRLRVSGAKTEDGVWDWCFNFPAWQATCQ
jgi:opacity protein-like surface antigen